MRIGIIGLIGDMRCKMWGIRWGGGGGFHKHKRKAARFVVYESSRIFGVPVKPLLQGCETVANAEASDGRRGKLGCYGKASRRDPAKSPYSGFTSNMGFSGKRKIRGDSYHGTARAFKFAPIERLPK